MTWQPKTWARPRCDDEYEGGNSFGRELLLAIAQGAAPVVAGYLIHRFFEKPQEETEE